MSLYNMLFGRNPMAPTLLAVLGHPNVGRFRDAYLDGEHIVIHTRNGGGNRACYCDNRDAHDEGCLAVINEALTQHPQYVSDADDDFDCTYADFRFSFPPEHAETLRELSALLGKPESPAERWKALLEKLSDPSTPMDDLDDVARAMQVGEQIIAPLVEKLNG